MRVMREALKRPFQKHERILLGRSTNWCSPSRHIASPSRNLHQQPPAAITATAVSSLESSSSFKYVDPSLGGCPSWDHLSSIMMTAVAAAAGGFLTVTSTSTLCEEQETAATPNCENDDHDDPTYENVPKHDEETTCLLCKTHRQGPCRKQWRSFEYCVKDLKKRDDDNKSNSSSSSSSSSSNTACDCYIKPFEKCWMKNLHLYVLIANTINQELVDDIEQDFEPFAHLHRSFAPTTSMPIMDWSKWMTYLSTATKDESHNNSIVLDKLVEEYESTKTSSSSSSNVNNKRLWEYFDELQLEPNLVTETSQIPIRIVQKEESGESSSLILRVVYAVDQDHQTVGYSEYNSPLPPPTKEQELEGEAQEQELQDQHHVLTLCLLPGITRAVRISAVYANESSPLPVQEVINASSAVDESPHVFLYTTPWTFLPSSIGAANE